GALDLITADSENYNVYVTFGLGNGQFRYLQELHSSAPTSGPAADGVKRIAVADLNGDTYADIASVDGEGFVDLYYNNGDGTYPTTPDQSLSEYITPPAGSYDAWSVTIADFNGDGWPDIASADYNHFSPCVPIHIWFSDGAGPDYFNNTIDPVHVPFTAGACGFSDMKAADIENDGDMDLIATTRDWNFFENDGSGNFTYIDPQKPPFYTLSGDTFDNTSYGTSDLEVTDFNHDNLPDFSAAAADTDTWIPDSNCPTNWTLMENSFAWAVGSTTPSYNVQPHFIDKGDLPGCTDPANWNYYFGQNVIEPAIPVGNKTSTWATAPADYNNDGFIDVASIPFDFDIATADNDSHILVYNNDGSGNIATVPSHGPYDLPSGDGYADSQVYDAEAADFNGDGNMDIVALEETYGRLFIALGNGDGTFNEPQTYDAGAYAFYLRVADVNNDGLPDVVAGIPDAPGSTLVILGRGAPRDAGIIITESGGSTNIVECGATDTYTVVLTDEPTATVYVSTVPDAQQVTNPVVLTFDTTNWGVPQTVTTLAVNDGVAEGTHTGSITHTATSADPLYDGIAVASVTTHITEACPAPTTPPTKKEVERQGGKDPIEQTVMVSKYRFADHEAESAIFCRDDQLIDCFTGTPLATALKGSLLVTPTGYLDPNILVELKRVLSSTHDPIYLLGREKALSPQVETDLREAGFDQVIRLGGAERNETAAKIAGELAAKNKISHKIVLSENRKLVDALGEGAIAGNTQDGLVDAILLTERGRLILDGSTKAFIQGQPSITSAEIIGGVAAIASGTEDLLEQELPQLTNVSRIGGEDRWQTNALLAQTYHPAPSEIVVASGERQSIVGALKAGVVGANPIKAQAFTDQTYFFATLLAGPVAADDNAPLLVVQTNAVPVPIYDYILARAAKINQLIVVGTYEQVSQGVENFIKALL
ncbi:MAG: FG-GAP-like repeat-containing protein, partial [Parcubacteria group bacterium]